MILATWWGYALAAQYPARITRWAVIDAPLPGIGDWDNIIRSPMLWHFNFRDPTRSGWCRAASGSTWDRFWNELSADPKGIDEGDAPTLRRVVCTAPCNS